MGVVTGDIKSLRASERQALERLASRRMPPHEVMGGELARRAAALTAKLGVQIGILVGRDGSIEHVIVGTRDRVYLPELGRFRLDGSRFRRLRLLVFVPDGERHLARQISQPLVFASSRGGRPTKAALAEGGPQLCPTVAGDLITDLEKLRLDALLVVAVLNSGSPGPATLMLIDPSDGGTTRGAKSQGVSLHAIRDINDFDVDFVQLIEELERLAEKNLVRGYDTGKDHAVLVGAYTCPIAEAESSMDELAELARTAGIQVLDTVIQRRRSLDPRTLLGKGKIEELVLHCLDIGAEMLIFDRELAPGQLRSITNLTELKVIDRSMLILDIFAQRAVSSEGRLQVELAQLRYSLPRLTERDSGMSRLTGGIGGRGPGETKLEIGRRRARDRITELERKIDRLGSQRGLRRQRRQNRGVPVIAIVGYTNAGKSTLINALTKGTVLVEDKLFATLDPTSRRMRFPNEKEVIFVDTVGFIRELPKELVTAFRATLEEVGEADLLLHVVDAAAPEMVQQIEIVKGTLDSLGFGSKPRILLLNKVDLLSTLERDSVVRLTGGIPVSAATRLNLEAVIAESQAMIADSFSGQDPGRFTELSSEASD